MNPLFEANYDESLETLTQTCELYRLDSARITYPIAWLCTFTIVSVLLINYESIKTLKLSDYLIYFGVWLGIFVGMQIFRRTFGRRIARTTAMGDADKAFSERSSNRTKPLKITIQFFDKTFSNRTQTQQADYSYGSVVRILESDSALGLVVRSSYGSHGIYTLPKDAVSNDRYDALKEYLVTACPKVNHIKKL